MRSSCIKDASRSLACGEAYPSGYNIRTDAPFVLLRLFYSMLAQYLSAHHVVYSILVATTNVNTDERFSLYVFLVVPREEHSCHCPANRHVQAIWPISIQAGRVARSYRRGGTTFCW